MSRKIFKRFFLSCAVFSFSSYFPLIAPAQEDKPSPPLVRFAAEQSAPYSVTERSDWSRYDNGKYTGHVYRELRASITPEAAGGGASLYRGNFFVFEETLRDLRQSAQALDEIIPVRFKIADGATEIEDDRGFPSLRGFPAFPSGELKPGHKWLAPGSRAVDPLKRGSFVLIPFLAEYEYKGTEMYKGEAVHRIAAKYASRFQGDFALQGTHSVDILIRLSDGLLLMMRDTLDESYSWPDGSTLRFRGFTLTFGQGIIPLKADELIASIQETIGGDTTDDTIDRTIDRTINDSIDRTIDDSIDISAVPEGIRLTIKEIRFAPDSAQFLPEERPRLDSIAEALKKVPDRTILVEGHTAAVGRPEGEMALSVERAQKMIEEMVTRGIAAGRFIYKGSGGLKPLADNSSEEGRRRNRRVEITILE